MKYHIYIAISTLISLYGLHLIYEQNQKIAIGLFIFTVPIIIAFASHFLAILNMIKSIVKII